MQTTNLNLETKLFRDLTDEEIIKLCEYSGKEEIFWLESDGRCWDPKTDYMAIFMLYITFKDGEIWETSWRGGRTWYTDYISVANRTDYTKDRERLIRFLKSH